MASEVRATVASSWASNTGNHVPSGVRKKASLGAVALAVLMLAACNDKNAYVPPPPPQVFVAPPVQKPVQRYLEFTGNTAAVNSVDLEARVQGFLETINYKDGALVKKDTLLFGIQRDQYQAQLDLQKAELASAQATQANAQIEYNRQAQLGRQDFASQRAIDDAKTNLDKAIAQIAADQANIQLATITLGYTQVTAPFDGIVTRHLVDVGALVGYSGPTKLATIVQVDPIYTYFTVSEQIVLQIKAELARLGRNLTEIHNVPVEIGLQDQSDFPYRGTIDYIAPQVDPSTGTLEVRGVFPNENLSLIPGLFVRVRIPVGQPIDALLVDDTAIGRNQLGSYVLVVDANGVVQQRQVTTGRLEGQLRVIEKGIDPGDKVIINGVQRAVPGNKVNPQVGTMAAATPAASPAAATASPPSASAPAPAAAPAPTKP
ncbi:RND family efflux transporter MFP subunit [Chelatococcus asaccharovorans]|uniref:RND family efflux transporter MFP subunit n=2 Tax=Chelatococcus asaccharovorans TaxID=28210 RepID=A0A2V3U7F3_9HYPH|nr:efflux RND transporter periplasmic adaptor subunit [Chelatococcus asaccharovorans]PXW58799.1 RND family efflux transporter MFP subunit [Chelatococcus asaccharovorans]